MTPDRELTRETFAPPFDLSTSEAWPLLRYAYRKAHAADQAAIEAFSAAERAASADPDARGVAPSETHSDALARVQHNGEIGARHGVQAAEERQRATAEWRYELVHAALDAPAPDLAALSLKVEMISDAGGWNDFDDASWPLFVADLQRLCGLAPVDLESQQ